VKSFIIIFKKVQDISLKQYFRLAGLTITNTLKLGYHE